MNLITINTAARLKNVSLGAITQAIADNKLHKKDIDGIPYVLENRAFEVWEPKRRKDHE